MPGGHRLRRYDRVDSTNEEARRLGEAGEAGGLWILAEEQGAGRGRRGRHWESPPGSLYASLLMRPDVPMREAAQLSFVTALAVRDTIGRATGRGSAVTCKWPNDVLVNGAKCAGILLEAATGTGGRPAWVVAGVGINVASSPLGTDYRATCIAELTKNETDVMEIFYRLAAAFDRWTQVWRNQGFEAIRDSWMSSAHGLDEPAVVRLPDRSINGIIRGIDENGALLLEIEGGEIQHIQAADVFPPGTKG